MNTKKLSAATVIRAIAGALAGGFALATWAQVPSQAPLLNRVANPPPPCNVCAHSPTWQRRAT